MAHTATLHFKVDADFTAAADLAPRIQAAVQNALTKASVDVDGLAGVVAGGVMAEILQVRQATPAEAALARVRALHTEEYGSCAECTHEFGVAFPCPTVRALDREEQC